MDTSSSNKLDELTAKLLEGLESETVDVRKLRDDLDRTIEAMQEMRDILGLALHEAGSAVFWSNGSQEKGRFILKCSKELMRVNLPGEVPVQKKMDFSPTDDEMPF